MIIVPQLECLYSEFLLHKLLISQNEGSRDKMIQTSHEILRLALELLKKTDVHDSHKLDLEWTVSCKIVSTFKDCETHVNHRWCFMPCHARAFSYWSCYDRIARFSNLRHFNVRP